MNKIILPFFACLLFILPSSAQQIQNASNIWYFGDRAGLDFNTSPPTTLTDGQLDTQEGVASVSDDNGNLLFYTDGITVWDRTHQPMPSANGTLDGHWSSTQSAIIVPNLSDPDIYYIFTTDELGGSDGLSYTVINMALPGNGSVPSPLGNVVGSQLNNQLITPVTEKIVGLIKPDYSGYWVVAHGWNNNNFYAYEITCDGLNANPVISSVGNVHSGASINSVGYMKATIDGQKLALVNRNSGTIDVYDFDNVNGIVSNELEIKPNDPLIYGIEFSFSGDYLYIGGKDIISQFSMSSGILINIDIDDTSPIGGNNAIRALQLGPDKNIYVSVRNHKYISAIYNPESNDPMLTTDAIYLDSDNSGRNCRFGLPNLFYFDFFPPDSVTLVACPNSQIEYNGELYQAGTINDVNLIGSNGCDSTIVLIVETFAMYNELLSVKACEDSFYDYNGNQIPTGTQQDFTFTDSNGCDSIVTVIVNPIANPVADAQVLNDLTCQEEKTSLFGIGSSGSGMFEFEWFFANSSISNNQSIIVFDPGVYTLIVTDSENGCTDETALEVFQDIQEPTVIATSSGMLTCENPFVTLDGSGSSGNGNLNFNWLDSNGNTLDVDTTTIVDQEGEYTLIVTDEANGCSDQETIIVASDDGTKIGNFVFNDLNENGIQDPFEPGVANIFVELNSLGPDELPNTPDDIQIDWVFSSGNGLYLFKCVDPGEYYLKFAVSTFNISPPYQGNDEELDSNADLITGTTEPFTVTDGMPDNLSFDVGISITACDDFTYGGTIGQDQIICEGDEAETLHTVIPPSGGSGAPEYLWLQSTNGSFWAEIPNSNTENYNPGPLFTTTYFRRCIRRTGCSSFIIESENMVTITVLPNEHDFCSFGFSNPSAEIMTEEAYLQNSLKGNQKREITVYPNPFSEEFFVEITSGTESVKDLKLYNANGQLLKTINFVTSTKSKRISMKNHPPGTYFLRIPPNEENSWEILRIVKM